MPDRPLVLAVASYASNAAARLDLDAVSEASRGRPGAHVASAVLEKGGDGRLTVDLHHNTAEHLRWGRGLLGGPLTVIATPVGIRYLVSMLTSASGWAGVGVMADHVWYDIPREQLRQMSDLLEAGQSALVVVAVAQTSDAIGALLKQASVKVVSDSISFDLESECATAIEQGGKSE